MAHRVLELLAEHGAAHEDRAIARRDKARRPTSYEPSGAHIPCRTSQARPMVSFLVVEVVAVPARCRSSDPRLRSPQVPSLRRLPWLVAAALFVVAACSPAAPQPERFGTHRAPPRP